LTIRTRFIPKTSLGAAAIARFVAVLLLALAVIAIGATFILKAVNENLVESKLAEEAAFFTNRTTAIDRSLRGVALAVRAQLEYSRVLDVNDTRMARARLVSYVQSFASVYPLKLVLVGRDGEVIMRVSATDAGSVALPNPQSLKDEMPIWLFDEAQTTLYRVISMPILVNGIGSHLLFYTAFDNALLTRNTHPGTRLALSWQGKRVAESVTKEDSAKPVAGRYVTGEINIAWAKGEQPSPTLEIRRAVPQPIVPLDVAVVLLVVGLLISGLGWLILGSWLRSTIGRIMSLNAATQVFSSGAPDATDTAAKLAAAKSGGEDEISQLAVSYERLVADVNLTNRELNAKLDQLREGEEKFRTLFNLSPFPITLSDPATGEVIETNQTGLSRLGYSAEDTASKGAIQLGIWADPADRQHFLQLLSADQRVRNFEATFRAKSGELVNALLFADTVRFHGRDCILSATIDVTELQLTRKALTDSEKRYATIIDAMAEGLVVHDTNGLIAEINQAASDILGVSAAQLRGQASLEPGWSITDKNGQPLPQDRFPSSIAIATKTRVPTTLLKVEHPNKRVTWIEVTALPLTMAVLGGTGALVTISDRTAEVDAQSALQHLADTLEKRVDDRTRELASANAELEAFSYSVSHDLRAPLRGIEGFSRLLMDKHFDGLDEEGRAYLGRVRRATLRMGEILDDLLALSQVSRTRFIRDRVDFSHCTQQIANELAQTAPDRVCQWELEPNLVVFGDSGLIRIALENLLGNAWKYSANTPHPTIRVFKSDETETEIELAIEDSGAGFDNTYVGQLFQPFKRLHDGSQFSGTGIGLATVKRVMDRHNGSVRAYGQVGAGAKFWLRFPKFGLAVSK
jgi:PAS domain S-box-containing protein